MLNWQVRTAGMASLSGESAILSRYNHRMRLPSHIWRDGPNRIIVLIDCGKVRGKMLNLASAWETLTWYTKDGAEKIGIPLD